MYFTDLNYDNYDDYLKGREWEEIHEIFYQRGGPYKCRLCGVRKSLVLHKRSYYFLTQDFFKKADKKWLNKVLVWLCVPCNKKVHFYNDKDRVPLDYLYLWDREQHLFKRVDYRLRRLRRMLLNFLKKYKK